MKDYFLSRFQELYDQKYDYIIKKNQNYGG